MAIKRAKEHPPGRRLPDLSDPEASIRLTIESLTASRPLEDALCENLDVSGKRIRELTAKGCWFRGVSLANCEIGSIHMRDVRMVKCDLSNAVLRGFEATRVEFVDCRLTGMRAIECKWNSVLIENCDGRYAQLSDGQLRMSEFRASQFSECDLRSVDLEGTLFLQTSLQRAELTGAKLAGTDLRGADIEGLIVQAGDVQGAIVTAAQAMDLARLLGLVIR